MDIRRLSLALFIALVLSAGATYLLYSRIQGQRSATPATIRVIAAVDELPAGTPLAADNLKVVDWPASMPLTGAFSKPEQVVGRSLIYPMSTNEPIVENDLAAPGSGIGLSVKIPEGMRAISIRSNDVVGVAGFVYPGSHVDVLLTFHPDNAPPLTQTILQDVEVLSAGQTTEPDPKGRPQPVNVVTLLLSPRDAQKLVLGTQQGSVQFVLRNGADQNKPDAKPVLSSQLVADAAPPPPARPHVATAAAPKPVSRPPEFYTVETIAGDKHTVEKF